VSGGASARTQATPVMTLVREHAERLRAAGVSSPEADAIALAAHALDRTPAHVRTARTADVPEKALERLDLLVARRAAREPLQHLLEEVGFRRLVLTCRPGVFVPRPETEILAGLVIDRVSDVDRPVVVEPCTGTGAIALAIATEVREVRVVASDVSDAAIDLARENVRRVAELPGLAAGASVEVVPGDLLAPVPADLRGQVDVVVSNPPYLTEAEVTAAPPEVRDHDPRSALVAAGDGGALLRRLLSEARAILRPGGWLLLETTENRVDRLAAEAVDAGYTEVRVEVDLAERARFVLAEWSREVSSW
jgi:release factor glutamine methyltransferase